eukprot:315950-Amphidinium_carterae.1
MNGTRCGDNAVAARPSQPQTDVEPPWQRKQASERAESAAPSTAVTPLQRESSPSPVAFLS